MKRSCVHPFLTVPNLKNLYVRIAQLPKIFTHGKAYLSYQRPYQGNGFDPQGHAGTLYTHFSCHTTESYCMSFCT